MEQGDEKVDAEGDCDGKAENGFDHVGLLHPLGCGGVEDHRRKERDAEREIQKVQHGRLPLEWSRPRPRARRIKDRLEIGCVNIRTP